MELNTSPGNHSFSQIKEKLNDSIWYAIYGLPIVALLFAVLRYNHIPVGSFFDDAHYIVLAKSLYSGQGYRLINFPQAPIESAFPPGWSLILGLYFQFIPFSFFTAKLPSFLFWLASIYLAYILFSPRLPKKYTAVFLGMLALNPNLIGISGTVMSESAYLFFSLFTIFLYKKWCQNHISTILLATIILFTIFTISIRSIGISLMLAVLVATLYQLRHIQLRYWIFALIILISLITPLILFNRANGGFLIFSSLYSNHIFYISSNLASFLKFWEHGTTLNPNLFAHSIIPIFNLNIFSTLLGPTILQILSLIVISMIGLGAVFSLKQGGVEELYFIFYLLIFYIWAVYIQDIQPRIAIPLIPFMIFYFTRFILVGSSAIKHFTALKKDAAFYILGGVIVCSILFNLYTLQRPFSKQVIDLKRGNSWLSENSATDAIVMSTNPVPDYLYSQRRTVNYNRVDAIEMQLNSKAVDYILLHPPLESQGAEKRLDPFTNEIILPYLNRNPSSFDLVFHDQTASVWVYKVIR